MSDEKTATIDDINSSLETIKSFLNTSIVKNSKTFEDSERKVTSAFVSLNRVLDELETKNYNMITELTDAPMGNVWTEEEKIFLDKLTLKQLFNDELWIYIVVDLISSKISSQPLKIYKETVENGKKIVEEAPNHPYNEVLKSPNQYQDYAAWMYSINVDLTLIGEAYIWKGINGQRLYQFPAETMDVNINSDGELISFERVATTNQDPSVRYIGSYKPEEMIQILRPNPSSYFYGMSPFLPGRKVILFNRYTQEYLNNFYLKGAVGGMVLELATDQSKASLERLQRSFEAAYTSRKNQRRTKILPVGVKASNISESLADQQLKDFVSINKEDILAILKVPKHEVGLQTAGSLGSEEYKQALKNFWQATLIPQMGFIKGKLNSQLKNQLGEGFFIDFDLSTVEALKENEIQRSQIADGLLKTHTINEVRDKIYSLGSIEGGDIILSLKPTTQPGFGLSLPVENQNQNIKTEEEKIIVQTPETKMEDLIYQADSLIKSSGDWFDSRKRSMEDLTKEPKADITKLFVEIFSKQAIEILRNIGKYTKKSIDLKNEEKLKKEIDRSMKEITNSLKNGYTEAYKAKIDGMSSSAFDHPYYKNEQEILSKISNASKKEILKFIDKRSDYVFDQVNKTTSKLIFDQIKQSARESDTIGQLAQKVSSYFSDPEKMLWRADRIARTETLTVLSKSQNESIKQASKYIPELKKMWISTNDIRTRGNPSGLYKNSDADHWHLHGQIQDLSQKFIDPKNGDNLDYPRDPSGKPSSVINCRCTYIVLPQKEMQKFTRQESEAKPNAQ